MRTRHYAFTRRCQKCHEHKPIKGGSMRGARFTCQMCSESTCMFCGGPLVRGEIVKCGRANDYAHSTCWAEHAMHELT